MSITTRSEYGMRAMMLLAEQGEDDLLSTAELARRALIPRKYLEQILGDLRRAGLVCAQTGVHGGYKLSRPAAAISAGEIVRCLDQVSIMSCVGQVQGPACDQRFGCSLRPLWQRLHAAMEAVLDATSLAQLVGGSCLAAPLPAADDENASNAWGVEAK